MFTHVSNLKRSSMNPGACSICLHMCLILNDPVCILGLVAYVHTCV